MPLSRVFGSHPLYHDPDRFDPDRWLPGRTAPPPGGLVPFGAGARKCIGDTFGMAEAILALAMIAARWQLHPVAGSGPRPALSAVTKPRGLRLRVVGRVSADSTRTSSSL
ncbi:cytochrome P450 [Nocardia terpenica]